MYRHVYEYTKRCVICKETGDTSSLITLTDNRHPIACTSCHQARHVSDYYIHYTCIPNECACPNEEPICPINHGIAVNVSPFIPRPRHL